MLIKAIAAIETTVQVSDTTMLKEALKDGSIKAAVHLSLFIRSDGRNQDNKFTDVKML